MKTEEKKYTAYEAGAVKGRTIDEEIDRQKKLIIPADKCDEVRRIVENAEGETMPV